MKNCYSRGIDTYNKFNHNSVAAVIISHFVVQDITKGLWNY